MNPLILLAAMAIGQVCDPNGCPPASSGVFSFPQMSTPIYYVDPIPQTHQIFRIQEERVVSENPSPPRPSKPTLIDGKYRYHDWIWSPPTDADTGYWWNENTKEVYRPKSTKKPTIRSPEPKAAPKPEPAPEPEVDENPKANSRPAGHVLLTGGNGPKSIAAWKIDGVNRGKLSPPDKERVMSPDGEGVRFISQAFERKGMDSPVKPATDGGDRDIRRLMNDLGKPLVWVIGPDAAKRKAVVDQFKDGGSMAAWKDQVQVDEFPPDAWQVVDVGIPSGGNPGVVTQIYNDDDPSHGKVMSVQEKFDPAEQSRAIELSLSTLRRRNPNFDPSKINNGGWWDNFLRWNALGFVLQDQDLGYTIAVGVVCVGVTVGAIAFVVFLIWVASRSSPERV